MWGSSTKKIETGKYERKEVHEMTCVVALLLKMKFMSFYVVLRQILYILMSILTYNYQIAKILYFYLITAMLLLYSPKTPTIFY